MFDSSDQLSFFHQSEEQGRKRSDPLTVQSCSSSTDFSSTDSVPGETSGHTFLKVQKSTQNLIFIVSEKSFEIFLNFWKGMLREGVTLLAAHREKTGTGLWEARGRETVPSSR